MAGTEGADRHLVIAGVLGAAGIGLMGVGAALLSIPEKRGYETLGWAVAVVGAVVTALAAVIILRAWLGPASPWRSRRSSPRDRGRKPKRLSTPDDLWPEWFPDPTRMLQGPWYHEYEPSGKSPSDAAQLALVPEKGTIVGVEYRRTEGRGTIRLVIKPVPRNRERTFMLHKHLSDGRTQREQLSIERDYCVKGKTKDKEKRDQFYYRMPDKHDSGSLELSAATWGTPEHDVSVLSALKSKVDGESLRIDVVNSYAFGVPDPAESKVKRLLVRYRYRGVPDTRHIAEGDRLVVPHPELVRFVDDITQRAARLKG